MSTTLVSPGVEISVIDQSQFTSSSTGTVPFIILATAQDKLNQSNVIAQYTTANTAGNLILETSQRSLISDFGAPNFTTSDSDPVNASELSEYGLMTAYSCLGISDQCYVMRAPIDLNVLNGNLVAPTGTPANGTIWLDTASTNWGLFEFNAASLEFLPIVSTNVSGSRKLWVITDTSQTTGNISLATSFLGAYCEPVSSIGKPGDYAVVAANETNPVWFMNTTGTWVLVGSKSWQDSVPAVIGTTTNPTATGNLILNGSNVAFNTANLTSIVANINAASITGINALSISSRLAITVDYAANSNVVIKGDSSVLTSIGIIPATYYAPAYQASSYTSIPEWNSSDAYPAPTGSVWLNTTSIEDGANLSVKTYFSSNATWVSDTVTYAANDAAINYVLDPIGGGSNIPAGTLYADYDEFSNNATAIILSRISGDTIATGNTANATVTANSTFLINTAIPGEDTFSGNVTISIPGTSLANVVSAVNSAGVEGIEASINSNYQLYIENINGATFYLYDGVNTPLHSLGILEAGVSSAKISNWGSTDYVVSATQPTADTANGAIWYYDDPTAVDILINTGSAWASYRTVTADARGYDLTLTDVNGPIVSASTPVTQENGNALAYGDLWINTSDLSNLPSIYRYSSGNVWSQISNSDHTSSSGIVFADARWSAYGNVDPGLGNLEAISTLLTVTPAVLDSDAPSYALYPRGTLLYNTRRSGYNVKQFFTNYLTNQTFTDTWVTASGATTDGVVYLGPQAQRNMVVKSMISAIESSNQLSDEYYSFNLLAAPGYPELLPTLVTLNEDRGETAFIVTDSPMTLAANANDINNWVQNINGATTDGKDGLVTRYDYAGVYYPAGLTTDLSGNDIVVPSSFLALPTIINSDAISYPWYAPAGATRGLVTNVSSIGYVDEASGNYITNSVSQALRDVMYPYGLNPISNFKSGGIMIYGQKTLQSTSISTELSRINVARLIIYLRQQLAIIGRNYLFEQNDSITRAGIVYEIGEFLKTIQSGRGIYDYAVVSDLTNNTPEIIDANELYVDVAIAPETAVEFIYIPLTIYGSGVLTSSSTTSA